MHTYNVSDKNTTGTYDNLEISCKSKLITDKNNCLIVIH